MSDRTTYLELLETEIDAAAKQFAHGLHEYLAPIMEETFTQAAAGFPGVPEKEAEDLVIPALKLKIHAHLARINGSAASGWMDVFYGNLNDHYNEGGDSEISGALY